MRSGLAFSVAALVSVLVGCSSSDAGNARKPGPCRPDPSLDARRDACEFGPGASAKQTIGACTGSQIPIEHIVLVVMENHSFDQYFGHLPGNGQDDVDVAPANATNPASAGGTIPWHHETHFCVEDTDHGWGASHEQYDGGKNDGFASSNEKSVDPTGARALGYYDQTDLPFYYQLASTFATSDRYFCSLLGPTYPNRYYFFAGTSFGIVTTDVGTLAPAGSPSVFRELLDKGVSFKIYRTDVGSNSIFLDLATDPSFALHLASVADFATDAAAGTLPAVSFVDPGFLGSKWTESDEHPPANVQVGQHWVYQQVKALIDSPQWPESAMFITYDEHGGLFDHVPPPAACAPDDTPPMQKPELGGFDRLGFRVPLLVVSPWAKRHFVSHSVHSHTSVLRFVQAKFGLSALTGRDANSDALLDLFDFDSAENTDVPTLVEPPVDAAEVDYCKQTFPN